MITPLGFIDTSTFTSMFVVKYKDRMEEGLLHLRREEDLPILKEWKSARAILLRIKNRAAETLKGDVTLGQAFIETLPPHSGTPWAMDESADQYARLRICLTSAPGCWSFSGTANAQLAVGIVNLIENRILCSEINLSDYPRTHLVVDVSRSHVEA